jgi:hypothetical protein
MVFNNCTPTLKGCGAERSVLVYCETLLDSGFDAYAVFPDDS